MRTCIATSPAKASFNMFWNHRLVQSKTCKYTNYKITP
jgi:hypothetical protein